MPHLPGERSEPAQAPSRIKPWHVLAAFCLVSVVMIGFGLLTGGRGTGNDPPLTREEYDAAAKRWEAKRPSSYDVDVEFYSQNAPVDIHLEVRDGKPVALTKNGVRMAQESRREEWTIDRLLQQIGQDLKIQEDPDLEFDVKAGVKVDLKAAFDQEYGYPKLYRRLASGSPVQYSYEIVRFSPVN